MAHKRIIVVGAGAAGMLAAGRAAQVGAEFTDSPVEVVLLERMRQVGRKIRISGKGRCNLTNTLPTSDFVTHFGKGGRFLRQALARFATQELLDFLHGEGLETVIERGGRIFPASGSAIEVVDTLERWVHNQGVDVITGARVRGLDTTDGRISGLHYDLFAEHGKTGSGGDRGAHEMAADIVILATGGKSYPATGSSGDGYDLAGDLGHAIVPTRPSLVPLHAAGAPPEGVRELLLRNIEATLWVDGKLAAREFGELRFKHKVGLTGPIILEVSRIAVAAVDKGCKVELSLDLKPALDHKKLDARLIRELEDRQNRTWKDVVTGLLPSDLHAAALAACTVPEDQPCHQVNSKQRRSLLGWLKDYRFAISGYGSFSEAIVTAGGVDTKEVDPRSLESRLVPGLFIMGELLNLDADTGGFNLMGAFSTGWVGGEAAARQLSESK